MLLLPEQRLKALMDFFLQFISEDYLFKLFGNQTFGKGEYNYFENAKALFLRGIDSPRKVACNIFFNQARQNLPTIHIALNQDIPGEGNGLGFDPGLDTNPSENQFSDTFSRVYSARFNIIFTSDNSFEVLLMYNVIRALVQGNPELLELSGLSNIKLSGQDLVLTDYLMPPNIYARGFIIDCLYEITVPSINVQQGITQAYFETLCGHQIEIIDNG